MLGNFLFKVIKKIIVERLGNIANKIVSQNQFGFIKGRHIKDCIIATLDCVNLLDKQGYDGNVALKIDIRKSFHSMS